MRWLLVEATDRGILQATRSSCGPLLGVAPLHPERRPRAWSEHCMKFNDSVIEYLARDSSIDVVVMSASLGQYVHPASGDHRRVLVRTPEGRLSDTQVSAELAHDTLTATVAAVRALGKRVILVGPLPSPGFDVARCLERRANRKLILGAHSDCSITTADLALRRDAVHKLLDDVHTETGVPLIRLSDALCSASTCRTEIDGVPLYRDQGHLSHDGSRALARRLPWTTALADPEPARQPMP